MSIRQIHYARKSGADYDALKFSLGSMRGLVSMDMDADGGVSVSYDDTLVSDRQISRSLTDLGYAADSPAQPMM